MTCGGREGRVVRAPRGSRVRKRRPESRPRPAGGEREGRRRAGLPGGWLREGCEEGCVRGGWAAGGPRLGDEDRPERGDARVALEGRPALHRLAGRGEDVGGRGDLGRVEAAEGVGAAVLRGDPLDNLAQAVERPGGLVAAPDLQREEAVVPLDLREAEAVGPPRLRGQGAQGANGAGRGGAGVGVGQEGRRAICGSPSGQSSPSGSSCASSAAARRASSRRAASGAKREERRARPGATGRGWPAPRAGWGGEGVEGGRAV